ncbi:MAG: Heme-binding protein A precursor [Firmicutes bacterium ADurb.Bin456]|nr:MAG: Heme-binding protein A precursor [Firmicutes bacterium ADurb.Bin456]
MILSLLIPALTGCGTGQREKETAGLQETTCTIADPTGDWGFPSPFTHYLRGPGYVRMSYIFDTLLWKDSQGYIPALAKSWDFLKDENAYLFKLQDRAAWHDGEPFTAKDVAFSFNYLKEHNYEWIDLDVVQRAEKVDDLTVKLYLNRPYAPFLEYIAGTVPILPEHIWKEVGEPKQFVQKEALIGTGPFKLKDYNKEQGTYLYEANAQYYQGKPKTGQLKFVKVGSEMTVAALRQKQVNAAQVPAEAAGELKKEGFQELVGTHDYLAKLIFNHREAPLNNVELRRALAFAIDRQALVTICQRGHGIPGNPGLVPPDSPWYNPAVSAEYPFASDKTRELLTSLGYVKNGNYFEKDGKVLELELLINSTGTGPGSPSEREGEMIKNMLEEAGIKIDLRSLEAKTLDSRVNEWKFDLALSGHGGMGADPEFLNKIIVGKGFNSARFDQNEKLNSLLGQQMKEMDPGKRKELVKQIQEVYAQEVPCLPLYYPTWYYVADKTVPLYFTLQGIGNGVPHPYNKAAFQ